MGLSFETDVHAFSKSVEAVKKLLGEEAVVCFAGRDSPRSVKLEEMDASHIAVVTLRLNDADLRESQIANDRFCLDIDKLDKVLDRTRREDETVVLDGRNDKVNVSFPRTNREYSVEKIDREEPSPLPEPKFDITARVKIPTKEFKEVLKDIEAVGEEYGVRLHADADEFTITDRSQRYRKRFPKGDVGLMELEVREKTTSDYPLQYMEDITRTAFDTATLEFSKDMPLKLRYDVGKESSLEYLLAPRIGEE
jgi:proliferating cell nuclear antigen